jgi:predicted phosphoribosyltransferase
MRYVPIFKDRVDAGKALARDLAQYANRRDVIVLALPRGGVPVAYEVAAALNVPMDVFIVRKLGVPGQEEFGFGAIASGGTRFVNQDVVKALRMPDVMIERVAEHELAELERREKLYRGNRPEPDLTGKIVIIVDDGLATGSTMRAAVTALKTRGPSTIIVAVPVASEQACDDFKHEADVMSVCAVTPEPFFGVGMWYEDFAQTTDDEVRELLNAANKAAAAEGR